MVVSKFERSAHPILKRDYQIPTPPIAEALAKIQETVLQGGIGAAFDGNTRSGKTTMLEYAAGEITDCAGRPVPVLTVTASKAQQTTENRFYEHVYSELSQGGPSLTSAGKYLSAIMTRIACECRAAGTQDCIIALDEAGRWPWQFLVWISDIQNLIIKHKVNLVVVIASRGLPALVNNLIQNQHEDVVARFFTPVYDFRSIKGVREVKAVLKFYDTGTEYPPGSGISYSTHFLGQQQIAPLAKEIWSAYQLYYREKVGRTPKVWPMAFLSMTIEQLLVLADTKGASKIDEGLILKALERSAFSPDLAFRSRSAE